MPIKRNTDIFRLSGQEIPQQEQIFPLDFHTILDRNPYVGRDRANLEPPREGRFTRMEVCDLTIEKNREFIWPDIKYFIIHMLASVYGLRLE